MYSLVSRTCGPLVLASCTPTRVASTSLHCRNKAAAREVTASPTSRRSLCFAWAPPLRLAWVLFPLACHHLTSDLHRDDRGFYSHWPVSNRPRTSV